MDSYLNNLLIKSDKLTLLGVVFYRIVDYRDNFYSNYPTNVYLPFDQSGNHLPFAFQAVVNNGPTWNLYFHVNDVVLRVYCNGAVSLEDVYCNIQKQLDLIDEQFLSIKNTSIACRQALSLFNVSTKEVE